MDDQTLRQVEDWIQFFRDLEIADFYRRDSGPEVEIRNAQRPAPDREVSVLVPAPEPQSANASPLVVSAESRVPRPEPLEQSPSLRMPPARPARSLSLFEAPPSPAVPGKRETLEEVRQDLGDCQRCKLSKGRRHIVFGQGNPQAELVFIGEGPGADEDEQGLPFVGRAGQLLNRMLQLISIKREDVYICNVVKCRPPGNRTPEQDEIASCSPFLFRQLDVIQPRLICCLGVPAARTVLGIKEGITKIHGRLLDYGRAKAMATVHPAYVLRNPREEVILREDFEKIRDFLKSSH